MAFQRRPQREVAVDMEVEAVTVAEDILAEEAVATVADTLVVATAEAGMQYTADTPGVATAGPVVRYMADTSGVAIGEEAVVQFTADTSAAATAADMDTGATPTGDSCQGVR